MTGPTPAPRDDAPEPQVTVNKFVLLPHGWRDPMLAGFSFAWGVCCAVCLFAGLSIAIVKLARAVFA